MRRMSFAATISQMTTRTKTVTRRKVSTWADLKEGDVLLAIEKGQGLEKGDHQVVIGTIRVVSNREIRLCDITSADVVREGFPLKTTEDFIRLFKDLNGGTRQQMVRRIQFVHLLQDGPTASPKEFP